MCIIEERHGDANNEPSTFKSDLSQKQRDFAQMMQELLHNREDDLDDIIRSIDAEEIRG